MFHKEMAKCCGSLFVDFCFVCVGMMMKMEVKQQLGRVASLCSPTSAALNLPVILKKERHIAFSKSVVYKILINSE